MTSKKKKMVCGEVNQQSESRFADIFFNHGKAGSSSQVTTGVQYVSLKGHSFIAPHPVKISFFLFFVQQMNHGKNIKIVKSSKKVNWKSPHVKASRLSEMTLLRLLDPRFNEADNLYI